MTAPLTAPSSQTAGRVGAAPQRFLVTGGSGFIGRALVPHLLMAGHTVTVLSRQPTSAARRPRALVSLKAFRRCRPMRSST